MIVAVACSGLSVARGFDTASDLSCYTVDRGIISTCQNIPLPPIAVEKLAPLLKSLGVSVLITGRISVSSAEVFCASGIEVVAGVSGEAVKVATDFVNHNLMGADELC